MAKSGDLAFPARPSATSALLTEVCTALLVGDTGFHTGEKQRKPTWSQYAGISVSKSRKSKAGSRKRARHDQEQKQAGASRTSNAGLKVWPWQERWSVTVDRDVVTKDVSNE